MVPPFTGTAVYVTDAPVQTGFSDAEIVTLTGVVVFFFIVMAFEVAGFWMAQERFDVILQVMKSPSDGVYVY